VNNRKVNMKVNTYDHGLRKRAKASVKSARSTEANEANEEEGFGTLLCTQIDVPVLRNRIAMEGIEGRSQIDSFLRD